ncbi:MAG: hypothetical protein FWG85_07890, partial [Bacteroidetes bacterium]|nr:hypothetical protein [Bacteroidota bacterium]
MTDNYFNTGACPRVNNFCLDLTKKKHSFGSAFVFLLESCLLFSDVYFVGCSPVFRRQNNKISAAAQVVKLVADVQHILA